MSDTKVITFPDSGSSNGMYGLIASLLQRNGLDPNLLLAMNRGNNGFGGEGGWFMWIIFLFFLMGWGRNGWGGFGGNDNGCGCNGTAGLANLINNDNGRELLMSAIQGNGQAIAQLASTTSCSIAQVQQAINSLSTQILQVSNQVGMTGQQVINAIQSGNCNIANQLQMCCCDLKTQIASSTAATERGFSSIGYALRDQTCQLSESIKDSTAQILAGQAAIEKRELQREIAALQDEKQTYKLGTMMNQANAPLAAALNNLQSEVDSIKCRLPKTETIVAQPEYIPVNRGINIGLQPYLYGGFNGGCGCNNGSLWG